MDTEFSASRSTVARLATVASGGVFTLDDAVAALGTPRIETSRRLSALIRAGWISRVRRGVFSIRPIESLPGSPTAAEDPWAVAMRVFAPCYIGGWTAAGHWGLTEQLFRATSVVTRRHLRKTETTIGGSAYRAVRDRRTTKSGLTAVWHGNARALVSSVERTLVDGCAHPDWIGGGAMLVAAFRSAVADALVHPVKLLEAARHAPSGATLGRLGVLIDRLMPDAESVRKYSASHRGTGYVRFDPRVKRDGTLATRWGVWLNLNLEDDA